MVSSDSSEDEYLSAASDPEDEYISAEGDSETSDYDDDYSYEDGDVPDEDDEYGDTDEVELPEKSYKVLIEEDIRKQQQQEITQVSDTLSIPRVSATILLRHYNWDVIKAKDEWFADQENVRKDVGLLEGKGILVPNRESIIKCGICFEDIARDDMFAASCGHLFCNLCWTQYVSIKISEGSGCLMMRCPDPSCGAAVGQDMVDQLVSDKDKKKYSRYLYRSYIEDKRKKAKWCPGPDCEFAIEFVEARSPSYDVVCSCGHSFCWNCDEDAHRPVDCDTVHNWNVKNTAESENLTWILANSKSCPKCKLPIEKNEGCMHMRCSCGHQFCWLCLGDWRQTHGKKTGGYYACNVYEKAKAQGRYDKEETIRKKAKDYIDRYAFYYERFIESQKSRLKAVESLQKTKAVYLAMLSDRYTIPETELEFIKDAWLQIIECRRVLKWTYVYGYYLPTSEHAMQTFFQCLQGEAQYWLEKLHQWAEVELQTYLEEDDDDEPKKDFNFFRMKLLEETNCTMILFEKLVRDLENGLSHHVDSIGSAR